MNTFLGLEHKLRVFPYHVWDKIHFKKRISESNFVFHKLIRNISIVKNSSNLKKLGSAPPNWVGPEIGFEARFEVSEEVSKYISNIFNFS